MLPLKIKFTWNFSSWLSHHAIGKGYRLPCMNSQSLESLGDSSEFTLFSPVKNIRVFCANKFAFGKIIRELLKANDFKNETWLCTHPPLPLCRLRLPNISPYPLLLENSAALLITNPQGTSSRRVREVSNRWLRALVRCLRYFSSCV